MPAININRKIHIMMLEEQLKRYWFFRYLGCYSIDHDKTKSILESVEYTKKVVYLDDGDVMVVNSDGYKITDRKNISLKIKPY